MRKRSLIAVLACLALGTLLLTPASALAANPLTISDSPTTTGGPLCSFTVTAAGQNVNAGDLQSCLETQNVTIADPPGDGGEIDVEYPISVSTCPGRSLTLDEEGTGGTVEIGATTSVSCTVDIEAAGALTGTADVNVDTLELNTGGVTLDSPGTNAVSEVEGSVDGAVVLGTSGAVTLGPLADAGGDVTIETEGSVSVAGALDISGEVLINAPDSGSSVTEQSGASITAANLHVTASSDVTLDGSGNQFGLAPSYVYAQSYAGAVSLIDHVSDLDVGGIQATTGGFDVANTGDITVSAQLQDPNAATNSSLSSQNGSVTEVSGAGVGAAHLTVTGTSVSLGASNYVQALDATASSGNVDAELYEADATLGNITASGGTVNITNTDDSSLEFTGTIAADSIALSANGFTAASGAALDGPSVALTDTDTSDDWSVNASTITAGTSPAIPYTSAASLSIDGGALFNVVPSPRTTMTFTGDAPTAGALDYNAEGGLVSGSSAAPSGTIDNSEYDPVNYSGMTSVAIADAATPATTATTPTTTTPPPTTTTPPTTPTNPDAPTCTLRAASSRVTLPKRVHGKLKGTATVSLVASCDASVSATLVGRITVVSKPAHGKAKSKGYGVALVHVALGANAAKKIVLNVPRAAVTALARHGDKLSARFTLADPGHGDDVLKTATITHLT